MPSMPLLTETVIVLLILYLAGIGIGWLVWAQKPGG